MKSIALAVFALVVIANRLALPQQAAKPNIVVVSGDDIGMWNVGAYTHGMMGAYTQHRQPGEKRHALYRPLRPAQLHRRPRGVRHGTEADPHA